MRKDVNKPMKARLTKATLTVYRTIDAGYEHCFAFPSEQQLQIEAHIAKLGGEIMFSITGDIKPLESLSIEEGPFDDLMRRAYKEARIRGFWVSSLQDRG